MAKDAVSNTLMQYQARTEGQVEALQHLLPEGEKRAIATLGREDLDIMAAALTELDTARQRLSATPEHEAAPCVATALELIRALYDAKILVVSTFAPTELEPDKNEMPNAD